MRQRSRILVLSLVLLAGACRSGGGSIDGGADARSAAEGTGTLDSQQDVVARPDGATDGNSDGADSNGPGTDAAVTDDWAAETGVADSTQAPDFEAPKDSSGSEDGGDAGEEPQPVPSIAWFGEALESGQSSQMNPFLDAWDGPFCEAGKCLLITFMPGCPDVQFRGEPNDWKEGTFMTPVDWFPGLFYLYLDGGPVDGHLEYKLFCNAQWSLDPLNRYIRFADIAINSALYAAGRSRLALVKDVYSPQLENSRALYVYVPAAAFENPKLRFPTLYMQDGFNVFANPMAPFGSWDVDLLLDGLIAAGEVEPLVVVGIDTSDRMNEYLFAPIVLDKGDELVQVEPRLDAYAAFLVDVVVPLVEDGFPALEDREHRAMAGSSLGGISSLYIAWTHAESFGRVASLSGSFWVGEEESGTDEVESMRDVIAQAPPTAEQKSLKVYLDSGDGGYSVGDEDYAYAEDARAYTDWVRNQIIGLGFDNRPEWDDDGNLATPPKDFPLVTPPADVPTLYWEESPPAVYGGWGDFLLPQNDLLHLVGEGHLHNEAAWKARFPAVARFLFPPEA